MKVLQVINAFYPPYSSGGAAHPTYNISKQLMKRGHTVTVYATNILDNKNLFHVESNPYNVNNMEVWYFRNSMYSPRNNVCLSLELVNALKMNITTFDLVHVHEFRSFHNAAIHHYAKSSNTPYVLQARGSLPMIMTKQKLKLIYDLFFGHRLLKDASKVIALTKAEAQQCKSMGVPEEKIVIIPNGIDLSEYVNVPPKGSFKRKFDIPEGKKIILYLGRIHEIKGIDILVKAYAYALKELRLNDALLAIAGPDDGYLGRLKQLLSSLKMINDVLLTGPLYGKDKLEASIDADIFVLPSRYETFPNVVLEAYACSKPVIASNVESIPDIVLHGKTGLLFRAGDVEELAEMISYMLTHSEEAKRMGHRARKVVDEKFSIDKVVDSIEVLYEKTLEK